MGVRGWEGEYLRGKEGVRGGYLRGKERVREGNCPRGSFIQ